MDQVLDTAARGRVVAAFDASDHADLALRWAAEQAVLEHRGLLVVSVGDEPGSVDVLDGAVLAVREAHPGVEAEGRVVPGDPRQVLLDASTYAHLMAVGSRGRGPFRGLLLGSVSAAVSAHGACPVVVCRPRARDAAGRGILVGADGTPDSLPVLDFAYRQAALRDLPLTVLHSFWDAAAALAQYREARHGSAEWPGQEVLRATLSQSMAGFAEDYPDVSVTLTLEHGFADAALTDPQRGWELVVVGHHPVTSRLRLLTSSVSATVVERARSSVAVVPQPPDA